MHDLTKALVLSDYHLLRTSDAVNEGETLRASEGNILRKLNVGPFVFLPKQFQLKKSSYIIQRIWHFLCSYANRPIRKGRIEPVHRA
jgi:hypothetical protein